MGIYTRALAKMKMKMNKSVEKELFDTGCALHGFYEGLKARYRVDSLCWYDGRIWAIADIRTDADSNGKTLSEINLENQQIDETNIESVCQQYYDKMLSQIQDEIHEIDEGEYDYGDYSKFKVRQAYGSTDWVIYGRVKGRGRFKVFTGEELTNKIMYGVRFAPDDKDKALAYVEQLNLTNPEYEFEARRGKGSSLFGASDDDFDEVEEY